MQTKTHYWPSILLAVLMVFSGHKNVNKGTANQPVTRAVLFGVSTYTDTLFAPIAHAKLDVEQVAAYLRTRSGGFTPADLIKLNTGEAATMAHFLSEISWLEEESLPNDGVVIYLTCHARLVEKGEGKVPYLFFHDVPYTPAGAGGLPLVAFLKSVMELKRVNSVHYQLYLNLKTDKKDNSDLWQEWMLLLKHSFAKADFNTKPNYKKDKEADSSPYLNEMISGLMGDADLDHDEDIRPSELIKYLNKKNGQLFKNDLFFLAFSSDDHPISKATKQPFNTKEKDNYPFLISQETSSLEDSLLKKESKKTQQWYNDFIISLKLGRLISPAGNCASDFYDSLATVTGLQPLHRDWQRQLGVALLDETQQVLNNYLKSDTREIFRRRGNATYYDQYPAYMEKAIEIMGERTFMSRTLKTKQHYFEGLKYRLASEKGDRAKALEEAKMAQRKALSYEPAAAYVLNEIGVLHDLLGSDSAAYFFLNALEYSPTWCIPKLNLSVHFREKENTDSSFYYAIEALKSCPGNVIVLNNLGDIYTRQGKLVLAENCIRQAIALNNKYEVSYYNLACVMELQGNRPAALHWLEEAIKFGFLNWGYIEKDKDLADLILTKEFGVLKNKYLADAEER